MFSWPSTTCSCEFPKCCLVYQSETTLTVRPDGFSGSADSASMHVLKVSKLLMEIAYCLPNHPLAEHSKCSFQFFCPPKQGVLQVSMTTIKVKRKNYFWVAPTCTLPILNYHLYADCTDLYVSLKKGGLYNLTLQTSFYFGMQTS